MRSVRVLYEKFGPMKFISHLDMNRFMIRMVRVSNIPVWYSEGFNPHPYITFALPLSLGFDSSYEVMDIRLDDDNYSNSQVFDALSSVLPDGIKLISVSDPVMKAGEINAAKFIVTFEKISENLKNSIESFFQLDEILTEKKSKKGKINLVDISKMIYDYKFEENELIIRLAAGGNNNLNPKLLLDAFARYFDISLPKYSIKRIMIYADCKKPFI